ncbi:MAG TPA: Uma2 family endonuclease [Acidimicrobiales bacterium]|nr:Uma2 family endonuclease [Acidimicrobiales bacterium]
MADSLHSVRAVLVDVPESLLEERRQTGADVWDEVWEGVLHTVPAPSSRHQRFGLRLAAALLPVAEEHDLLASYETGLYNPGAGDRDYRVPDLVFARPENVSDRGVEGRAELVVEILSPGDETYDKLDFYSEVGVQEVLVADPESCGIELFSLGADRLHAVAPDSSGSVSANSVGVSFQTVDGPTLHLSWPGGATDIPGRA